MSEADVLAQTVTSTCFASPFSFSRFSTDTDSALNLFMLISLDVLLNKYEALWKRHDRDSWWTRPTAHHALAFEKHIAIYDA